MSSKRKQVRAPKAVSPGETLGVLACLLAAVMLMSMGWLLSSSNKVARANTYGTSAITVPL
jgi:hypothetical protein